MSLKHTFILSMKTLTPSPSLNHKIGPLSSPRSAAPAKALFALLFGSARLGKYGSDWSLGFEVQCMGLSVRCRVQVSGVGRSFLKKIRVAGAVVKLV